MLHNIIITRSMYKPRAALTTPIMSQIYYNIGIIFNYYSSVVILNFKYFRCPTRMKTIYYTILFERSPTCVVLSHSHKHT